MRRALLAGSLLLAGCDLAPAYHPPEAATPAAYVELADWQAARPADAIPRGAWWSLYADPVLDGLEARVTSANQDIKAAFARLEQARAAARAEGARLWPEIDANGAAGRQQLSRDTANLLPHSQYNEFQLGAALSYEIDLWGRVRNLVASAEAQAAASAGDLATLDLESHAELAGDYFTLRGDDAKQEALDRTVEDYTQALALTRSRFAGGAAPEADVDQAETQLHDARTRAADLRLQRATLDHAIAVLAGLPPEQLTLPPAPLAATPPAIEVALPASLLERRPDIAAAERRVAAANAGIGIARAAFFPRLSLDAAFGLDSASTSHLFTLPSRTWSFGPSAAVPLFDAGRLDALSDQARAAYDETAAQYRQTVLVALREVEDDLAALRQLATESATEQQALDAAERALVQANHRYAGGIATYLEVITAENEALQARLTLEDIRARRMAASVDLVRALGGGWQREAVAAAR